VSEKIQQTDKPHLRRGDSHHSGPIQPWAASKLIGSPNFDGFGDDSCKDEDNASWVLTLEKATQLKWIERLRWLRAIDRIAEQSFKIKDPAFYSSFITDFEILLDRKVLNPTSNYFPLLQHVRDTMVPGQRGTMVESVSKFVSAVSKYHQIDAAAIETLADYQSMLENIGGNFFQTFPDIPHQLREPIFHFGALEHFYNNLRDLREDAENGICYIPGELLSRFSLTRTDILSLRASTRHNFQRLMEFLMSGLLLQLKLNAAEFIVAPIQEHSFILLRESCLRRHARIEYVIRVCNFDFVEFSAQYWKLFHQETTGLKPS
jgi:phytoene synthase